MGLNHMAASWQLYALSAMTNLDNCWAPCILFGRKQRNQSKNLSSFRFPVLSCLKGITISSIVLHNDIPRSYGLTEEVGWWNLVGYLKKSFLFLINVDRGCLIVNLCIFVVSYLKNVYNLIFILKNIIS